MRRFSGHRPFAGEDAIAVASRITTDDPAPIAASCGLDPRRRRRASRPGQNLDARFPTALDFGDALGRSAGAPHSERSADAARSAAPARLRPTRRSLDLGRGRTRRTRGSDGHAAHGRPPQRRHEPARHPRRRDQLDGSDRLLGEPSAEPRPSATSPSTAPSSPETSSQRSRPRACRERAGLSLRSSTPEPSCPPHVEP